MTEQEELAYIMTIRALIRHTKAFQLFTDCVDGYISYEEYDNTLILLNKQYNIDWDIVLDLKNLQSMQIILQEVDPDITIEKIKQMLQ